MRCLEAVSSCRNGFVVEEVGDERDGAKGCCAGAGTGGVGVTGVTLGEGDFGGRGGTGGGIRAGDGTDSVEIFIVYRIGKTKSKKEIRNNMVR